MTKKQLKKTITEACDKALLTGKTEFTIFAREDLSMNIVPRICSSIVVWVDLDFGSGIIRLMPKDYNRKQMIGIYTNIIWAVFFNYES